MENERILVTGYKRTQNATGVSSPDTDITRMQDADGARLAGAENEEKNVFLGISDIGQAETILSRYRKEYPQDVEGAENLMNKLMDAVAAANPLVGDANDFHNFSVSISKLVNDNKKALFIVEKGLGIYQTNTDLLADAIQYGYSCGEHEKCHAWFEMLQKIDKARWTWRAFSFSIDYLLAGWTSSESTDYSTEDILALANSYQENLPDNEDAWNSEYEIYEGINQKEKGVEVLERAIQKFRFCPRCWLHYVEFKIDNGEYEEAEPVIKKILQNPKSREKINISYVHFVDGLCKLYRLNSRENFPSIDGEETPERREYEYEVWSIYRSFHKALSSTGIRETIKAQIFEYTEELYIDSGIEFPDEWR